MVILKNIGSCSRTCHIIAHFYMNLRLMGKLCLLFAVWYHRKSIASCLYPGRPRLDMNLRITNSDPCNLSELQCLQPHCEYNQSVPFSLSSSGFCEGD